MDNKIEEKSSLKYVRSIKCQRQNLVSETPVKKREPIPWFERYTELVCSLWGIDDFEDCSIFVIQYWH